MTVEPQLPVSPAVRCDRCGTELAPRLLVCPSCHRLVHAAELADLQAKADAATRDGAATVALEAWRRAIDLVPEGSRQHEAIGARIDALVQAGAGSAPSRPGAAMPGGWKWLGGAGAAGLLLWKFKFLLVAIATKGKLLLLGLTKASTFFSMALSLGVYWAAWGLWFAFGLVVSIYIHEMGHVAALRRFGIPATAPMFVPGFGAFVRLRAQRLSPYEDARIGLAGPIWGLGAAAAAFAAASLGAGPMWAGIASVGAWINLFNLMPMWQLDGNRGIAALSRPHRWIIVGAFAAAWMWSGDGLLVLLMIVAGVRAVRQDAPAMSDQIVLGQFVGLIAALTAIFHFARPFATP
jgi:Zn-dependent protease